jgi:uronate dehydrogenase
MKRILFTGASGALGRVIAPRLAARGHALLLSDIAEYPDPVPDNARFRKLDLGDRNGVLALASNVSAILHFGAVSTEQSFEEILAANIRGIHHIFELARATQARVIFASSNHTIGFHERSETLDVDCEMRPDGYYGLSKAYGELLARMYWYKHGVESLSLRIGTSIEKPLEPRHLSTWLSFDDLTGMIEAGLKAPKLGCRVIWGVSDNNRSWWNSRDADLGIERHDNAEDFANSLVRPEPDDPIARKYQGGPFCSIHYSRKEPLPS